MSETKKGCSTSTLIALANIFGVIGLVTNLTISHARFQEGISQAKEDAVREAVEKVQDEAVQREYAEIVVGENGREFRWIEPRKGLSE